MKQDEKLRFGYTTGTAVTAASVAAMYALFQKKAFSFVTVTSPAGLITVPVNALFYNNEYAKSSITKDGGDDPDYTHGLEIIVKVYRSKSIVSNSLHGLHDISLSQDFYFFTAEGIGVVTLDGLPVKVGEPAVNPGPRKMIKENVERLVAEFGLKEKPVIVVSVPKGAEVAKHTLNERLGVKGGISILGTTGVVKPVSMDAFTATIDVSLNIAKKKGLHEVVLCFGRTSEAAAKTVLSYPDEAYIMMGDFFKYAMDKAKKMDFKTIVSGQLGKILKICLDSENTNVKYGVFSPEQSSAFLEKIGIQKKHINMLSKAKTARHMWEIAEKEHLEYLWGNICSYLSKKYLIQVMLFSYKGTLLAKA